jgi:hypothetical protein
MKTRSLFALLFLAVTFSSCMQTKQARITADQFYEMLMNKDYDGAVDLIHSDALQITPKADWFQLFKSKEAIGEMKSFKKQLSTNTQINNGVTTVSLKYTTTYGDTQYQDDITIRNEGKKFKIYGYSSKVKS